VDRNAGDKEQLSSSHFSCVPPHSSYTANVVSNELPHVVIDTRPVQSAVQQFHASKVSLVPQELMSVPVAALVRPWYATPVSTRIQSAHASLGGGETGQEKLGQVKPWNHVPFWLWQAAWVFVPRQSPSSQHAPLGGGIMLQLIVIVPDPWTPRYPPIRIV